MTTASRLQLFKTQLQEAGLTALADVFEVLEARLTNVGWHFAHFTSRKPRDKADNERLLSQVEARFNGKLPPEVRASLLDLYAICNGFTVVVGPVGLASPTTKDANRDDWVDRPIGYQLVPFAKVAKWLAQFSVNEKSAPLYHEGGLRQLFNSDFDKGAKADTAALRYSSYVRLDDDNKLEWTYFSNESYAAHSLAIANDKFPGGYLGADGDQRPLLMLDKKRKPLRITFAELIALELQEALGHFFEAAEVVEAPRGKRKKR